MNCTYFYRLKDGTPLYIGVARNTLEQRIKSHARQEKFAPYIQDCEILYHEWKTKSDAQLMEKLLIKSYKPILNVVDTTIDDSFVLGKQIEWMSIDEFYKSEGSKSKKPRHHKKTAKRFADYCCIRDTVLNFKLFDNIDICKILCNLAKNQYAQCSIQQFRVIDELLMRKLETHYAVETDDEITFRKYYSYIKKWIITQQNGDMITLKAVKPYKRFGDEIIENQDFMFSVAMNFIGWKSESSLFDNRILSKQEIFGYGQLIKLRSWYDQ